MLNVLILRFPKKQWLSRPMLLQLMYSLRAVFFRKVCFAAECRDPRSLFLGRRYSWPNYKYWNATILKLVKQILCNLFQSNLITTANFPVAGLMCSTNLFNFDWSWIQKVLIAWNNWHDSLLIILALMSYVLKSQLSRLFLLCLWDEQVTW